MKNRLDIKDYPCDKKYCKGGHFYSWLSAFFLFVNAIIVFLNFNWFKKRVIVLVKLLLSSGSMAGYRNRQLKPALEIFEMETQKSAYTVTFYGEKQNLFVICYKIIQFKTNAARCGLVSLTFKSKKFMKQNCLSDKVGFSL